MKAAHQKIVKKSQFDFLSEEDVEKLYHHFLLLDSDSKGELSVDELVSLPGAKDNPLARRIVECLDANGDGRIEFGEFVNGLAVISSRCSRADKIRFAFDIYDIDKDGYISNGELFLSLKIMSGEHLEDVHLQQVVDKTIRDADRDGDGKISFPEFVQLIEAKNSRVFDQWCLSDL